MRQTALRCCACSEQSHREMMPPLLGILLSVALPWVLGAGAIHALARRVPHGGLLAIGYGYLLGAFVVTLLMRAESLAGMHWTFAGVAGPIALLALVAGWLGRPRRARDATVVGTRTSLATASPFARAIFWTVLVVLVARGVGLALEVFYRPVQPWDAWSHWATKAKVWYAYGRMLPFVQPGEWLRDGALLAFTDQQPGYPATVPLLQVWTTLWLPGWNDAWMNAPWPVLFASLGCAAFAQARRAGIEMVAAMVYTWLLLSLPFLEVHVALAGLADVFLAAAFGLCVMALALALERRQRIDILLAVAMAVTVITIKLEGALWLVTLLPALVAAYRRRLALWLAGISAAVVVLYLAFGPAELRIFGYVLRTAFTNVSLPVLQHMFVMDNWHLFWYAVLGIVLLRGRTLLQPGVAPLTLAMLAGIAFIAVVFFFSSAAGGVDDETLVNRLLLQIIPALSFYALWLLRGPPAREQAILTSAGASAHG